MREYMFMNEKPNFFLWNLLNINIGQAVLAVSDLFEEKENRQKE